MIDAVARLKADWPEASEAVPTEIAAEAIHSIAMLLSGQPTPLSAIPLDMRGLTPFRVKVYEAARSIGPGETRTYGEVAQLLSLPGAARAVGQALSRNPFAIVVPCHRVLSAGGKLGGFTAVGGVGTKRRLLAIEERMTLDL